MSELDSDSRRYFMKMKYQERQFLRARDFRDEQNYHIEKAKNHNSTLHTRGICGEGMKVTISKDKTTCVNVSAGTAIDASGNTIFLAKDETVDLSKFSLKTGEIFLTVRYGESNSMDPQFKQDEGGFKGVTRTLEKPDFELWSAANTDPDRLLLAVIDRKDGKIVSCDDKPETTGRLVAGVEYADVMQTGNLANQSVTTAKIQDGAVTSEKLEQKSGSTPGIISTANLPGFDRAEEKAGLGGSAVDKSIDSFVTAANLQGLDLTEVTAGLGGRVADRIKDGFVTTANLQGLDREGIGAVSADKIKDSVVTTVNLQGLDMEGIGARAADRIKDGFVTAANLQGLDMEGIGAVRADKIKDSVVTTVNLQGLDMTEEKEKPGVVNAGAINGRPVSTANLQFEEREGFGAVNAGAIQAGALNVERPVTSGAKKGAVATANIQDGAVTSAELEKLDTAAKTKGAVATANIQDAAVTSAKIGTGAVTEAKLGADAVTTSKIITGAVTEAKLVNNAVTADKIKDGAVTEAKIIAGAVTSDKLEKKASGKPGAVATANIQDAAVTSAKLEKKDTGKPGAVATANIQDAAVTSAKLEIVNVAEGIKGAVATANIQDAAVTSDKLEKKASGKLGAVATANIQDGAVTPDKIGTGAVTAVKIIEGSLPFNKLSIRKYPREFSIKRGKDDASSQIVLILANEDIDRLSNYPFWINVWATGTESGKSTPTVQWYHQVRLMSDKTTVKINLVVQVTDLEEGDTAYCKCVLFQPTST